MPKKKIATRQVARTLFALALLCSPIFFTACSKARGQVVDTNAEADIKLVDEELDYGFIVTVIVKNVGEADSLRIKTRLSCSEGEWERTQNLYFASGETKKLTYFFHEPTINATSIYYGTSAFPGVDKE